LRMQEWGNSQNNDVEWKGLTQIGADWVRYGPQDEDDKMREEDLPPARWYIVQCNPGLEDAVGATLLAKRANSKWLQKTIIEVLVPCTNVTKLGLGGKKVVKPEKLMPGYVLLNMKMDKDSWFTVKNSNHVQNFVGHDRARRNAAGGVAAGRGHVVPTPLSRAEEKRIMDKITSARAALIGFEAGDAVIIREGVFEGNTGRIVEADHVQMKYKVRLDLFKKEIPTVFTPVEMEPLDPEGEEGKGEEFAQELDEDDEEEARVKSELLAALEAKQTVKPWKEEQP